MRMALRFAAAIVATTLLYSTPVPAPAASVPPSFTIAPSAAEEDSGRLCFPVRMHGTRSSLGSSVKVSLIAGTARPIEDYVAATREMRFEPSEFGTSKVVCFDLVNDARPEPTETVTGKLAKGTNSRIYRGSALGTITDTDQAEPGPIPEPAPDPAPTPAPAPTGHRENVVGVEGDSISYAGGYQYPSLYDQQRASVSICGLAVGGSNIITMTARISGVRTCNGEVVTVLIGANDTLNYPSAQAWAAALWAYTDRLRAEGYKVAVGTLLPRIAGAPANQAPFNARRVEQNALIRASVGVHLDAVIDFAADPRIGDDADALDKALFPDGLHPSGAGHAILASIYAPVVDKLLTQVGLTPRPGTTPPPQPQPQPEPTPTPAPGGTAWVAEALVTAPNARALKSCSSIYRTAETDRVGIAFRGVTAGAVYALNPWGRATSWGHTPARNSAGQSGTIWAVADAAGEFATVAAECLEGVRPAG